MKHSNKWTCFSALLLLFIFSFGVGTLAASIILKERPQQAVQASANGNWGLSFQTEGKPPVANATAEQLAEYNACYAEMTDEKVLYLTFDAGYENGHTPAILDALKKHHVPAAFFIVGNYLETSPELVKRMVEEGHLVANHTYHHPDMSNISSKEAFQKELTMLEEKYTEITGLSMAKYYRPPQGKYSEQNLQMAKDLGYTPFFGALLTSTGIRINSRPKKRRFKNCLAGSIRVRSSFSTALLPRMLRSSMSC